MNVEWNDVSNYYFFNDVFRDYEDFLQDLEEDAAYREGVNIYRDRTRLKSDTVTDDEGERPKISLEEMLDDLTLSEAEGDPAEWDDVDEDEWFHKI